MEQQIRLACPYCNYTQSHDLKITLDQRVILLKCHVVEVRGKYDRYEKEGGCEKYFTLEYKYEIKITQIMTTHPVT